MGNLAMNPQGSIPWFVMDDGTVLAETIAMCEYVEEVLPEPPLIGSSPIQRGVVRQWQRRMEEHYCYPAFYGHRFWTSSEDCPEDHFMKGFFEDRLNQHYGAKLLPYAWKDLCTWAQNRIEWLEKKKQPKERLRTSLPAISSPWWTFRCILLSVFSRKSSLIHRSRSCRISKEKLHGSRNGMQDAMRGPVALPLGRIARRT